MAEIPAGDPARTLRELNDWFGDPESFITTLPPGRALRALEELDEFAQDAVQHCWDALLADAQAHRQNQQLASGVLKVYLSGSYTCNRRLLERLAADPEFNQDKKPLAQLAARAMYNWVRFKKLERMAYHTAEPSWWRGAHDLLGISRELGFSHQTLSIYPQQPLMSSLWKEYQVGLLFETAPLTNLTANEIEATEQIVRWVEPHCRLMDTPSAQMPYCIVLNGESGPSRWQGNGEYSPDCRFFGIGQGHDQLAHLSTVVVRERKIPEWLTSSRCNREQVLHLLQKLVANWSTTPPSRQHPRLKAKGTIRVVNGLDLVRRMLSASEFAKSGRDLDYDTYLKNFKTRHREHAVVTENTAPPPPPKSPMDVLRLLETAGDQQMTEFWEITDMSRGGLGVRFNARRPWLRIGSLIGYRMDDELDWRVAIVRRLGSTHGKPNAGLSTFTGIPTSSQIRSASAPLQNDPWSQRTQETSGLGWHNAILISTDPGLVLIPAGVFTQDHPVHLSVAGRWRLVRLTKLLGRGNDYDLASYQEDGDAPSF